MSETYLSTRARLATYFDRTAAADWARLTSDAPVSRIRETVRAGRDAMRATLLTRLPASLAGARILDAGCGVGQLARELAARGAEVVAVDISPSLVAIARDRTPASLADAIHYRVGDMLDPALGRIDFVVAMDSLIHYRPRDIADTLGGLAARTSEAMVFTIAPRTPLLTAMHAAGRAFPRKDRAPSIVPVSPRRLARELDAEPSTAGWRLSPIDRVASGFYISQAMEMRR